MTIIISTTWLKSKQIYKSQQSIDIEYLQKREQQRQKNNNNNNFKKNAEQNNRRMISSSSITSPSLSSSDYDSRFLFRQLHYTYISF